VHPCILCVCVCACVQVDWIYQQEMHAAEKDGRLYDLQVAFSRDDKKQKTYVQVTPCTCVHA
jgi:hypothetical protein